ncbi:MAG: nucleotidyltransferase family protein, partial [Cyanobium sp.]
MAVKAATSLRRWLQWRLALERQAGPGGLAPDQLNRPAGLVSALVALPSAALLAEIRRQRLAAVLAPDLSWLSADPALAPLAGGLRRLHQQDTRAALALQHLTLRVLALFTQAGLPVLVLKGIPLALQTT